MRSLVSWSPQLSWPVAKLGSIQQKRAIPVVRYVARTRQERGREIEKHGQPPLHFRKILKYAINEGIGRVAKPESKGEFQSTRSLNGSESEERQLRRQKSFFTQIQSLNGSQSGPSHAERDGHRGSLESLSKDRDSSEGAKPVFFDAQVPGKGKAPPFRRYTFLPQDSAPSMKDGRSPTNLKLKNKDAQDVLQWKHKRFGKSPKLSLFEELFPEEAAREDLNEKNTDQQDQEFPRLPLPEMIEDEGAFEDEYVRGRKLDSETTEAASKDAYRLWNLSVLVLQVASPSLDESDFRRIAPRGQHIEEWVGPGDFFKVIPGRDALSLKQKTHYWLVFPNPAYALAYQNQVMHLHELAGTHTPTSIESPMTPPKGMFLKGEEVYKLLQDYALCPPSKKIDLATLFPPHSIGLKRIIHYKGYPELTQGRDKTGKAVRFWVEGFVPTTEQIQQFIGQDGRRRGMAWALMDGKDSIQQIDPDGSRSNEEESIEHKRIESESPGFRDYIPRTKIRWIIAFEDENEARRFVRRWHLRPFTLALEKREYTGDHAPLVHAEYMW